MAAILTSIAAALNCPVYIAAAIVIVVLFLAFVLAYAMFA